MLISVRRSSTFLISEIRSVCEPFWLSFSKAAILTQTEKREVYGVKILGPKKKTEVEQTAHGNAVRVEETDDDLVDSPKEE